MSGIQAYQGPVGWVANLTVQLLLIASLTVCLGWVFQWEAIVQPLPGYPTMKFWTAVGFSLIAAYAYLARYTASWLSPLRSSMLALVPVIALCNWLAYFNPFWDGFDELLVKDVFSPHIAGRMSQATSLGFILLSVTFAAHRWGGVYRLWLRDTAFILISALLAVAWLTQILSPLALYQSAFFATLSLQTKLAFTVALLMFLLVEQPADGLFRDWLKKDVVGQRQRRVVYCLILAPFAIALAFRLLERMNHYLELNLAIYTVTLSAFALGIVLLAQRSERRLYTSLLEERDKQQALIEALRLSEQRFGCVVEAAGHGLVVVDQKGIMRLVNRQMEQMFGFKREELIGQPVEVLIRPGDAPNHASLREHYSRNPESRPMAQRGALAAVTKGGEQLLVEVGLAPLTVEDEQWVLGTVMDVTEQHQHQKILQRMVDEKSFLLNEVHHRVKNNLQVICSLLNMQAMRSEGKVRAELMDFQSRIRSMALIHQLLYQQGDFEFLELGEYLKQLTSLLEDSVDRPLNLQVSLSGAVFPVLLEQTLPLGMIVTELVTNALKHARVESQAGTGLLAVRVELEQVANDYRLSIRDNGNGWKPGEDDDQGNGLSLCRMLSKQLSGQLIFAGDESGAVWQLDFPKIVKSARSGSGAEAV